MAQRRLEDDRKMYVEFKLQVLRDCCLPLPSREEIDRLLDEERTPTYIVDAFFHQRLVEWK